MDTSFIRVDSHSSVRIEADGKVIYVDPYLIEGEPSDADYIFITHEHYDHFSPDDIAKIIKPDTGFVFPQKMEKNVKLLAGEGALVPVLPGNSYSIGDVNFETVAAYNVLKPFHTKTAKNCGYVITANGLRIYVAGDMDITSEAKNVECDIAIVPCGGTYTMNYKEAAKLVNAIRPSVAIPTHYGKVVGNASDGDSFAKLVDDGIQVDIKLKF
ncbi:MAG: MBL fold metallo-hydrolase [Clostridiales bacterium]|nr:MBL fold metallo-hydrolase [Clostridiales bacterium]